MLELGAGAEYHASQKTATEGGEMAIAVEDFPTALTAALGIRVPIIQAPIGSFSCPELAAAVSEAGGLGTLALSWDSLDTCRRKIEQTQQATRAPFGINLALE